MPTRKNDCGWLNESKDNDVVARPNVKAAVMVNDVFVNGLRTSMFKIKQVIFNKPATIILWANGDKTVVKCQKGDKFDKEKGFALAFTKYALGNKSNFNNIVKNYIDDGE